MPKGKLINIILHDGTVNGRIEVTLDGWTGIAYRIVRENIEAYKNIDKLKQSGVYFLYGEGFDKEGNNLHHLYIGQAGHRKNGQGILSRIQEHKAGFWTDAIVLIDKANEFGKTEICYLENRFANIAKDAKCKTPNYVIENGNDPNDGNVIQHKQWALDDFIDGALLIIESLRYDFFISKEDYFTDDLFHGSHALAPTTESKEQSEKVSHEMPSNNPRDSEINFKVGKIVDCAFRYAIENGLFTQDEISFLQTRESGKRYKTDGGIAFLVDESDNPSSVIKNGLMRYYATPVKCAGKAFYMCSQLRTRSLGPILDVLKQKGLSNQEIVKLCSPSAKKQTDNRESNSKSRAEGFRIYLLSSMPKSSANSYFSSLKLLDRIIREKKILHCSLFEAGVAEISTLSKYLSTDRAFKRINKDAHCRYSSAFRKYVGYLQTLGLGSGDSEPVLRLNTSKANAKGKRTCDGFVVFKGSKVASAPTQSCPDNIKSLREKNADRIDINHSLTEDVLFSSPSAAAGFVNYASANGLIMWVAESGKTLKELESNK